jgi:hypothetical protein
MTLRDRDRRALTLLAVSAIVALGIRYWPDSEAPAAAPAADAVTLAEARLARLREAAATVPAKEDVLKKVSADLATREKSIISAPTAAQAQAQLIQIIRRVAAHENPPIDIRQTELSAIRPLGDAYGEANVAVQIECRIDQLVNLLAALQAQPELIATDSLRITSANAKDKTVGVRLSVSGVVPRKLVPEKSKAGGAAL